MVQVIVKCKVLWQRNPNTTNVACGLIYAQHYKETAVQQKTHTYVHAYTCLSGCCFFKILFSHPSG